MMGRSDRGQGKMKAILSLAFLAAVAYAGVKIIPVYVQNYELQDYIRQIAVRATVDRTPAEAVQNNVVAHARDNLRLPITRENVKVQYSGRTITIDIDYTVPVDLKVYTLNLRFTPSAENRAL
jgi:hypothetical protein